MTEQTKVLVLEEERMVARAVQRVLEAEGFLVTVTATPDEALDSLAAHLPDVLLLDVVIGGSGVPGWHRADT